MPSDLLVSNLVGKDLVTYRVGATDPLEINQCVRPVGEYPSYSVAFQATRLIKPSYSGRGRLRGRCFRDGGPTEGCGALPVRANVELSGNEAHFCPSVATQGEGGAPVIFQLQANSPKSLRRCHSCELRPVQALVCDDLIHAVSDTSFRSHRYKSRNAKV